jgi:hypothetical protein
VIAVAKGAKGGANDSNFIGSCRHAAAFLPGTEVAGEAFGGSRSSVSFHRSALRTTGLRATASLRRTREVAN